MDRNLTMMTDLYQLTMMQGYFNKGKDETVVFDMFYRKNPFKGAYAIACGLDSVIDYILNLEFSDANIEYLRTLNIFSEPFLTYLKEFKFRGTIYAIPEGTVVFPNEPLVRVEAHIMEAQLIETALLNLVNHQSLIATKASRVKYAAGNANVMEFGLRRAQGPDAGILGARAAIIGGCSVTSNVLAGELYGVDISGTHAHSWVMSFDTELEAFQAYADTFPMKCILLVDTYDTLKSGVPNAIKVFEELKKQGKLTGLYGIRLDSGDLAYLSKKARHMLDKAGFKDAIISASNDLDEYLITSLNRQGAEIGLWGVGTSMITAKDQPAFGGVYKLSAISHENYYVPKIKVSENVEKITNPGCKKIYRVYDNETHKIKADIICLSDDFFFENEELLLFDPIAIWKKTILESFSYSLKELLVPIFENGDLVYERPSVKEIAEHCKKELDSLWEESRRLENPHGVFVDLSKRLWDLKQELLNNARKE